MEDQVFAGIVKDVRQCARSYRNSAKRKKDDGKDKSVGVDDQPISKQLKGSLVKCLPQMMYGFGDAKDPPAESVSYLETIVLDRMATVVSRCVENHGVYSGGQGQAKAKLSAEDLLFEIRKDKRKHRRCKELLRLNEEIKQAKKSYEKPEMLEDGK
ncbi:subunit 13 of transcription initiation factor TFIID [Chloropicon roscoffensis]|uniref:Transcription initiation factor TFIID subunit 13 n=1 Tax=Chloropicon roscoffensis TaxID=1461544 RepID=A0AAX4PDJ2_9CHLO|mmetsp:Transcript_11939/g.36303  ORF Transcript_11939/g.36303 Transcript_11939/m.36303 type:complete len:156 (-) Transcript_11939:81-548(-)